MPDYNLNGPVPRGFAEWGIDLSRQNTLNDSYWDFLKINGCAFAILKGDSGFVAHATKAQARGIEVGAYWFLPAGITRGAISAATEVFHETVAPELGPRGIVALDIENGKGVVAWSKAMEPAERALSALQCIECRFGVLPHLYSNEWFLREHELRTTAFTRYPLWASSYPTSSHRNAVAADRVNHFNLKFLRQPAIWQYGGGPVDGMKGAPAIDRNVCFELIPDRHLP